MITTLAQAEAELDKGLADYAMDTGEMASDDVWFDLVVATVFTELLHDTTLAKEFCFATVGYVPDDLIKYLR